ncbi:MAG: preprotein translocase subunit YajC [Clostridia bacterium]|nr:preprotein translocase subunit YajC [Clostridia bacterium]
MFFNLLEDAAAQQTSPVSYIVMGVLIVAIIGLFIWQSRANKKRQKEAQDMVSSLKIGDRVKTIGGICGFVVQINDAENTFVLETGLEDNKSYVKFDKGAIYQTAPANANAAAPAKEEPAAPVEEAPKKEETAEEK